MCSTDVSSDPTLVTGRNDAVQLTASPFHASAPLD